MSTGKEFEQAGENSKGCRHNEEAIQDRRNAIISFGFYSLFVLLFSRDIADYDLWGYLSFAASFGMTAISPFEMSSPIRLPSLYGSITNG